MRECCCCGCCCFEGSFRPLIPFNPDPKLPNVPVPNDGAPVVLVPKPPKPNEDVVEPNPLPVTPPPVPVGGGDVEPRNDGVVPRPAPAGLGLLDVVNIDARNGLAPPSAPVACGRKPTPSDGPTPVGCPLSPGKPVVCEVIVDPGFDDGGDPPGVEGAEGMGGSESSRAAPNEDDGLNGFRPLKPVACLCKGAPPAGDTEIDGALDAEVAPVGCEEREENRVSENAEPVMVLDVG